MLVKLLVYIDKRPFDGSRLQNIWNPGYKFGINKFNKDMKNYKASCSKTNVTVKSFEVKTNYIELLHHMSLYAWFLS